MIEFVFTIDYEIYGNGTGALKELVFEPARRLRELFEKHNARFVTFVEVAEFEKIESFGSDPAIDLVTKQIRELHRDGFEIGLHLHPQWSNARYERGQWSLDLNEYNLCTLPRTRIVEIVDQSLAYLRHVVGDRQFAPLSFRGGNWLFQPTEAAASVLAGKGIKIDSSVFKGGLQRNQQLDYRPALKNGYFWPFNSDVNRPDAKGSWIEVPVYTEMVPFWKMATSKRMAFTNYGGSNRSTSEKLTRAANFMRFRYPLKLDFCRMTLKELNSMVDRVIQQDRESPGTYRPVVAIGHTKDLTDLHTVDAFLSFLGMKHIKISTFTEIYPELAKSAAIDTSCESHLSREQKRVPTPSYVLITPARNEIAFIEQTIQSVISQTVPPLRWVIVSDGSTDGTDNIVRKYAAAHSWIVLVRMPERNDRHFAGKVHAFNTGYDNLKDLQYDVIGNLDADITFDTHYFDFLMKRFAENPRLGVAGTPFVEGQRQYDYRFTSVEHVSGACQLFRRKCYEEIDGYRPIKTGGVDLVAVTTARMKGWETRSFPEKTSFHHRKMSSAKHNALGIAFDGGRTDYTHGSDPIWQIFRCLYQMTRPPILLGGTLCLAGFFWALLTGNERVVSPELVQFRKTEQMRRLREFFSRVLSGGMLGAS